MFQFFSGLILQFPLPWTINTFTVGSVVSTRGMSPKGESPRGSRQQGNVGKMTKAYDK